MDTEHDDLEVAPARAEMTLKRRIPYHPEQGRLCVPPGTRGYVSEGSRADVVLFQPFPFTWGQTHVNEPVAFEIGRVAFEAP